MAEYEYQGEKFQMDDSGSCEIKVSDNANTISITPNTAGPSVYRVSTVKGGWWWYTNTVKESVERACRELVESRTNISKGDACKELSEFVKNL